MEPSAEAGVDTGFEAGDASPVRCDPKGEFGSPMLVQGLSTSIAEESVWVSPDELTAYVFRDSPRQIQTSQRTRISDPFPAPTASPLLAMVNGGSNKWPALSADELILYVYGYPNSRSPELAVATRGSKTAAFSPPVPVYINNVSASGYLEAALSSDAQTLFVRSFASQRIFRIPRVAGGPQFFGMPTLEERALTISGIPTQNHYTGAISSQSDLFVYSVSDGVNDTEMYGISATPTAFAGAPFKMTALNSPQSERPGSFSADGCALYFTSARTGDGDVYVSYRAKPKS